MSDCNKELHRFSLASIARGGRESRARRLTNDNSDDRPHHTHHHRGAHQHIPPILPKVDPLPHQRPNMLLTSRTSAETRSTRETLKRLTLEISFRFELAVSVDRVHGADESGLRTGAAEEFAEGLQDGEEGDQLRPRMRRRGERTKLLSLPMLETVLLRWTF